jgi:hypothetical protein
MGTIFKKVPQEKLMDTTNPTTNVKKSYNRKHWTQQSFGDQLSMTAVLLSGVGEYREELARRGVNDSIIDRMEELLKNATDINNHQEGLKGELRKTTHSLQVV